MLSDFDKRVTHMRSPLGNRQSPFQQKAANLVDHRGPSAHPPLAHSMHRLQIQLFLCLDGHKTHRGPLHRFGDRFRIDEIAFVGLHIRLHILCRHQFHLVTLLPQSPRQEV